MLPLAATQITCFMRSKIFEVFAIWAVLLGNAAAEGLWSSMIDGEIESDLARLIAQKVAKSNPKTIDQTLSTINKNMPSRVDAMTTLVATLNISKANVGTA